MNRILYLLGLIIILISGCSEDYLNTQPSDQVSQEDMFSSLTNVKVAMNGVYRGLYRQYADQEEDGHPAIMICLDYMGEDVVHSAAGTTYFRSTYKWTNHRSAASDFTTFVYRFYYKTISDVNEILSGIDGVEGSDAEKNAIKGECLALRAWAHFQLVQCYGRRYNADEMPNDNPGVPIMTRVTTEPQPRATVEEVYTQINKDLDEAISYLAVAPSRPNKTHVDVSVARGFKARVALTMQNYEAAAQYAREARPGYGLMSNADYLSGFNSLVNSEWMWGANQLADQLPAYGSFFAYMSGNFNSAHTRPNPKLINRKLWDPLPATDIRKKLWWDGTKADSVNFPGVILASTGQADRSQIRYKYMHRKYMVKDPSVSVGDIPFMRVAEMYLIEAEALARLGRTTDAWEALRPMAVNRDPAIASKITITASEVMLQRRVELWGEGFRFLDLKRNNEALDRTGTTIVERPTLSSLATVLTIPIPENDVRWQFLLPRREMETNPGLVQNPLTN